MFIKNLLLSIFTLVTLSVNGQDLVQDLNFYADVVANAYAPEHRERALKVYNSKFSEFVSLSDASSQVKDLKYVMVKESPDRSFQIVTWQLQEQNNNQYFGYIFKDGKAIKLTQNTDILADTEYSELSNTDWYGAMYYNITQQSVNGQEYYFLYGYNAYRDGNHVKVVDVLSFDGDDIVLGSEMFKKNNGSARADVMTRLLLPYSENATVKLNFDEQLGIIIYDHIVKKSTAKGDMFIPDGSYVGYKWNNKEGVYEYVDKVFDHISTTPLDANPKKKKKRRNKSIYKRKKG